MHIPVEQVDSACRCACSVITITCDISGRHHNLGITGLVQMLHPSKNVLGGFYCLYQYNTSIKSALIVIVSHDITGFILIIHVTITPVIRTGFIMFIQCKNKIYVITFLCNTGMSIIFIMFMCGCGCR